MAYANNGKRTCEKLEAGTEVNEDLLVGYLVTYQSGEIGDHYRAGRKLPDGVHFMEGPVYWDNGE